MMQLAPPSPFIFNALLSGNSKDVLSASEEDLRPFLPALARMVLCPPVQASPTELSSGLALELTGQGLDEEQRKLIHVHIAGIGEVNAIRSYLGLNFHVSILTSLPPLSSLSRSLSSLSCEKGKLNSHNTLGTTTPAYQYSPRP